MISLLDHVIEPFRLGLMQRALIQVVVISAVGGAVGCFVVIRGLSFTGESLAHTVLPGVVVAYAIGVSLLLGAAVLAAVTVAISLLAQRDRRITEDTAMGVAFAGLFPLGVILLSLQSNPTRSLSDFLFGDVLANSRADVIGTVAISLGDPRRAGARVPPGARELVRSRVRREHRLPAGPDRRAPLDARRRDRRRRDPRRRQRARARAADHAGGDRAAAGRRGCCR